MKRASMVGISGKRKFCSRRLICVSLYPTTAASSICVMPTRRRRKRNKSPKVLNFSNVVTGMEVGIYPHPSFTLFYPTQNVFERFGEFWQIMTSSAGNRMLQWENKRPARDLRNSTGQRRRLECYLIVCSICSLLQLL